MVLSLKDMTDRILPAVLPSLFRGLQDVDDDVRAVAAAALVPVAHDLVRLLPQQVEKRDTSFFFLQGKLFMMRKSSLFYYGPFCLSGALNPDLFVGHTAGS